MNHLQLNLSGGMNTQVSPLILKDEECEFILNYHLDSVGKLTKRLGTTIVADAPSGSGFPTVNGLYEFREGADWNEPSGTSVPLMVMRYSTGVGTIYRLESGVWVSKHALTSGINRSRFATFLNRVFHIDGSSSEFLSSSDGATWNATNTDSTVGRGIDIEVFQDRLYVGGGNNTSASRVYFSSLPNGSVITWDTTNDYFDVNPDDNDGITALENNGNRLLIFKHRALYRWTFGQVEPDRMIGVGTSSAESVRTNFDLGITFFANQYGVYAYTGGRPKLISRKIQKYIDAATNWETVCAEVDNDHYYLHIGNITVDGRALTGVVLVYHISLDAWTIYSLPIRAERFARMFIDDSTESTYFAGVGTGTMYEFLSGTDDDNTTVAGTPSTIPTEFKSKEYLLSFPEMVNVSDIDIFAERAVGARAFYQMDRGGVFQPLGAIERRITNFRAKGDREGNTVQIKMTDNSANESIIEGFNIEYAESGKRRRNNFKTSGQS